MNHENHNQVWNRLRTAGVCLVLCLAVVAVVPVHAANFADLIAKSVQSQAIAIAIAANPSLDPRVKLLKWAWPTEAVKFAVYSGQVRNGWTNRSVIATNQIEVAPFTAYGIACISAEDAEGLLAYWPSNRIGQIRLREEGKTNFTVLEQFTNSPPEAMKLWRVENVTTGWQ